MKWYILLVLGLLVVLILGYGSKSDREIGRAVFTEVGSEAGLDYKQNKIDFSGLNIDSYLTSDLQALFSGGVDAGDYDNDGHIDLYVTVLDDDDKLFKNNGDGSFNDVSHEVGLNLKINSNGVGFVDVNNDNWLDIFVSTINEERNYLFINYEGEFVEEGVYRGFDFGIQNGFWPSFGDYDNDDWIDIHTTHWDRKNSRGSLNENYGRLFRNLGDGYFGDVTNEVGVRMITGDGYSDVSFASDFADLDNDKMLDLVVAADFGNSRIYWNENSNFIDGTLDSNVGLDEFGMGSAVGDYDNDGLLDWFVSSIYCKNEDCIGEISGNKLYHGIGDRKFEEVSVDLRVEDGGWGWNAEFFDYDLDEDLDLIMAMGMREKIMGEHDFSGNAVKLFMNDNGKFIDVTDIVGMNITGDGRDLTIFDFDNDNDLDVFVVRNGDSGLLFRNEFI